MANPARVSLPEWTWVKVAEATKYIRVYRENTTVYYYKTYRQSGDDAPSTPVVGTLPDDAIKIFEESYVECIESSESLDIYIMCSNKDDDSDETGEIIVGEVDNFRDMADQDQHTPTVIVKFNQVQAVTTLTAESLEDSDIIEVVSATGFVIGTYIIMFSIDIARYYVGHVIGVAGTAITLDTPLDATYPAGSSVNATITNMAVDGSTTRQVFGVRSADLAGAIPIAVDITRIIFYCLTTSTVDLSKFGDLPALVRGLVLRKKNGLTSNVFNIKSNGEFEGLTLDWKPYDAQNANQGQHGFSCRLTFNGKDKLGVTQRLEPGEDIELLVSDALQTLILLECYAEGSVVLP